MKVDERIVDRGAAILRYDVETLLVTNGGGRVAQRIQQVFPDLHATANVVEHANPDLWSGRISVAKVASR